jgi:glycosyltransferase involved in cell wall biosynthesis
MATSDTFISVVAPLYNDADIVDDFVKDLAGVLREHYSNYEIVLVDDGSRDEIASRLDSLLGEVDNIRVIRLSRRFGVEIAIAAGLESVIGDYVVVMDPETDPPALVPEIVELVRETGGSVVAVRRGPRADSWPVKLGARLFHWYTRRFLKLEIPENSAWFRGMSRQAVNAAIQIKDRLRHLRNTIAYVGYQVQEFPYQPISRRGETTKRGFFESVNLAISIVVANSSQPLRLVSLLGLAASAANVLYVGYVLFVYLVVDDLQAGWATRSIQTSLMFFLVFLILAILSEYVGRILTETQRRPLYYISEERNSMATIEAADRRNVVTQSVDG